MPTLPKTISLVLLALALLACTPTNPNITDPPITDPPVIKPVVGVTSELIKDKLITPWALAFAADGSLYFSSRDVAEVTLNRLDLTSRALSSFKANGSVVRDEGEGGTLGMALDPQFASNQKVYVCYSYWKDNTKTDLNRRNRLSSFVLGANQTLSSESILLDGMLGWSNHNGCRVVIGPDQKIYLTMGDAADLPPGPSKAQDKAALAGKIFRINLDGSIPSDNPFFASSVGAARAVWSYGHRNPQGLAFRPGTLELWSAEHGPNVNDELNVIVKGQNYGWPLCTGTASCPTLPDYQAAVRQYEPSGNTTIAISDLTFYNSSGVPEWKGKLFFVTLKTGRLYQVTLEGTAWKSEKILIDGKIDPSSASTIRLRDIAVGPDGFLYISTDEGNSSRIFRVKPKY
jgi:aldose sugar dehydrogenase